MAGMECLGRLTNQIPIAASKPFKMRSASGVMFTVTGADTFTLNERSSFAGGDTPLAVVNRVYWSTATDGTAAWSLLKPLPAGPLSAFKIGAGGTAGLTTATVAVFHVLTSQLSDPFNYLNLVPTAAGLVQAYLYDLVHQRAPANLEIIGS